MEFVWVTGVYISQVDDLSQVTVALSIRHRQPADCDSDLPTFLCVLLPGHLDGDHPIWLEVSWLPFQKEMFL